MMPDATGNISPKRPIRRRRLLVLAVLVLVILGWWWSQRSTMRLVARIALPSNLEPVMQYLDDPVLIGADSGVLMGIVTSAAALRPSSTYTFRDWNGKPRWQVVAPINDPQFVNEGTFTHGPNDGHGIIALSPDGHVFALALEINRRQHIMSWRDGRLLGIANLPLRDPDLYFQLTATNSGRVWLHSLTFNQPPYFLKQLSPYWLLAVDGAKVINGKYQPSFPTNTPFIDSSLSPAGNRLICTRKTPDLLEYDTVQVKNNTIVFQRLYTTKTNSQWFGRHWLNDDSAIDNTGTLMVDSTGTHPVKGKTAILSGQTVGTGMTHPDLTHSPLRAYLSPQDQSWQIPHKGKVEAYSCQANGRMVLLAEYDPNADALNSLVYPLYMRGILHSETIFPLPRWLAVYSAPGKLRAIQHLPRNGRPMALQLSPDGHHLAIIFLRYRDSKHRDFRREMQFFSW